jgi:hypothetical protein
MMKDINSIPTEAQYPTRFYAKKVMFALGVLSFGPIAVGSCYVGILHRLDHVKGIGRDAGTSEIISGAALMILVVACAFQTLARLCPVIKIHKEGLRIRTLGTPPYFSVLSLISPVHLLLFIITTIFLFVTLQMFRIRKYHLRWEQIESTLLARGTFTIAGLCGIENDADDAQETPPVFRSITYDEDAFGITSVEELNEAIQFFLSNPDARETLPSWQDAGTMFEGETF